MSAPNSTSPAPGRRAACDQCRAQKLRCVRDPSSTSAKCERCAAAKVTCNFGVPKPAGRPPATRRPSTRDSSGDGGSRSRSHPEGTGTASQSALSRSSISDVQDLSMDSIRSWSDGSTAPILLAGSSDRPGPPFDENSLPGIFDADLMHLDASTLTSPRDFQMNQMSFPWTPLPSASQPTSGPNTTDFSDCVPTLDVHDRDIDQPGFMAPGSRHEDERNPVESKLSRTRNNSHPTPQHRIQQLSKLSMSLHYLFIESNDLQQEIGRNGGLSTFPAEFAGRVLENSMAFLELLRSFQQQSSEQQQQQGVRAEQAQEEDGYCRTVDGLTPSTDSSFDESNHNPTSISTSDIKAKPQHRRPQQHADMTIVLQLLACYLHITQLHNILYTAIYHYVSTPQQDDGSNNNNDNYNNDPIFPGLHIGGVHLDRFGRFQIKFVLQISAHILGEIERALALPDGYRISRKRDDEASGILEVSIPSQFLQMTMVDHYHGSSSNGDPGDHQGGISGSKAQLGKLRVLLKGTINI